MVSDDRGQLILIGSIAIALILVGLVLVVNTALFTEVVGSEGTVETTKEGGVATQELEDAVSQVVHHENLRDGDADDSDIRPAVSELRSVVANSSVDSRGAFVNVTYAGRTVDGTRVIQNETGTFRGAFGSDSWQPVSDGDVGAFEMVIDVPASSTADEFEVVVDDAAGTRSLQVEKHLSGTIELETPETTCGPITPTEDTVRIDVASGRVYEDPSCTFDLFGPAGDSYDVVFDDGDAIEGRYWFVTNGTVDPTHTISGFYDDDRPTAHSAVWSYRLDYEYDTGEVTVEDEREVNVYD